MKNRRKPAAVEPQNLRIIGGRFRGRKLLYHGDPRTRPMKLRVREALFNLLGPSVEQTHAIDLFAGTGALGLEAVSRGAASATLIEQHFPTADLIERNIESLGVSEQCTVVAANAFVWIRQNPDLPNFPWVVLCSPPYDFYVDRPEKMVELIGHFCEHSPSESQIVVESDERFDFDLLPNAAHWDVRSYPPAVIGILRDK